MFTLAKRLFIRLPGRPFRCLIPLAERRSHYVMSVRARPCELFHNCPAVHYGDSITHAQYFG